MKTKIGVMGSAQWPSIESNDYLDKAQDIGRAIAEADCILVNGACPGLPDEAAKGAKEKWWFVLGVSPAFSEEEHINSYKSPKENYDLIFFTGMWLMERDILNIRSSDAIIVVGWGIGTLNEFTVAYDEGKIVGILKGSGGVSNHIKDIVKMCDREIDERIIIESNPKLLVKKVLEAVNTLPKMIYEDERIIYG